MTDDRMAHLDLIEKTGDADLVRAMLAFSAERLMDDGSRELDRRAGGRAQPRAAQSPKRLSRTGLGHAGGPDRPRHPQAAQRLLLPAFLEPRRTAEKALTAVIQEAYVKQGSDGRR